MSTIQTVRSRFEAELLKKANVTSVGIGYKIQNGVRLDEKSITVGVAKKQPVAMLDQKDVIPSAIDGIKTDVVETGTIRAFTTDPTQRWRPIFPGISMGHYAITAGTFGCVVKQVEERVILSNNHVLANSNNAQIGDPIYQPGSYDGGGSSDQVATLLDFVEIKFDSDILPPTCPIASKLAEWINKVAAFLRSSHRMQPVRVVAAETPNLVDAAIARTTVSMSDEIAEIGKPVGKAEVELGQTVQKFGRTTKYTTGEVIQTDVTVRVQYGEGKIATFVDQIVAGPMSQPGDSGSAVLDMNGNLVGLLFAGSDTTTIFSRITNVFNVLKVNL